MRDPLLGGPPGPTAGPRSLARGSPAPCGAGPSSPARHTPANRRVRSRRYVRCRDMGPVTTRRELLRGAAGGAALGMTALASNSLIAKALATAPACGASLSDIEHVVILIQENRSF